ncbi:MAG: 60S ribosomal protein L31 [Candidatus Diapherotrites archaeon]|uniref:Large ribosomal subunit protein eL31 n=1 Tax=Candidatus Iainarchaeum sp. TaxID=3101447 RepID=A0A938YMZ6_9ARCH|nr:60S ribosomal protein L31 [Candidatus Diapherotrites archaeon]
MAKKKKAEKKELEEKKYTVGMQAVYKFPRPKRAIKALTHLKRFAFKHTRIKPEDILISNKVNEAIWEKGREHPPRKLEIKVIIAEGKANVFLQSEKIKPLKEKKEEKKEEKKTEEEIAIEEEKEKKKQEKKAVERAAEAAAMKRGQNK